MLEEDVSSAGNGANDNPYDDSDDKSKKSEDSVPIGRFNQVYGQMKDLERQFSELKEAKGEGKLTAEQQKELQAKEYLKNLLKETKVEEEKAKAQAEKEEQAKFEAEVGDILAANPDVKRSDFVAFLKKEGDDYSSVAAAFKGYKRIEEVAKKAADEAKKQEGRKPNLPGSEGAGGNDFTPPEGDKNKSMWQIVQEATQSLKKK